MLNLKWIYLEITYSSENIYFTINEQFQKVAQQIRILSFIRRRIDDKILNLSL